MTSSGHATCNVLRLTCETCGLYRSFCLSCREPTEANRCTCLPFGPAGVSKAAEPGPLQRDRPEDGSGISQRRAWATEEALFMRAYYFSFTPTGVRVVDEILSAIACAGKAYHHTERWNDEGEGEPSWAEVIQEAAERAAALYREIAGKETEHQDDKEGAGFVEVAASPGDWDPFITFCSGPFDAEALAAIERDLRDNHELPAAGYYRAYPTYDEGQRDEVGRWEIPCGWGVDGGAVEFSRPLEPETKPHPLKARREAMTKDQESAWRDDDDDDGPFWSPDC